jgi:flagellar motility protein MotE (MotC chaperone)
MTQSVAMKPRRKIRLLPIVIVVVAVLLVVRLGEIAFGVELSPTSPALAEEKKAEDPPKAKKAAAEASAPVSEKAESEPKEEPPSIDFPVDFTPAEVAVLQALGDRRDGMIKLEKELDARERLLSAAEGRLDKRIGELQQLRDSIEALVRQYDDQEKAELQSIVKIYETMKPKDAAAILEDLEMPILLSIVEEMKERKSASILAAMGPARAREVTTELARERVIDLSAKVPETEPSG